MAVPGSPGRHSEDDYVNYVHPERRVHPHALAIAVLPPSHISPTDLAHIFASLQKIFGQLLSVTESLSVFLPPQTVNFPKHCYVYNKGGISKDGSCECRLTYK